MSMRRILGVALVLAALGGANEARSESARGTMVVSVQVRDACGVSLGTAGEGQSTVGSTCTNGASIAATVSSAGSVTLGSDAALSGMRIETTESTIGALFPAETTAAAGAPVRIVSVIF